MAPKRKRAAPTGLQAPVDALNPGVPPPVNIMDPTEGFDDLTRKHVELLRAFATVARALIARHLNDENFQRAVKFAYDQKIVSADKLGEIGRVDRTTASRWINGHSAPNPLAQEAILAKIAEEASNQANELRANGQ